MDEATELRSKLPVKHDELIGCAASFQSIAFHEAFFSDGVCPEFLSRSKD